jgi:FkbM family methyltransferase
MYIIMFFDIGANIGRWSLSNLNNASKIIAVEAVPLTFKKLVNNTQKNTKIICLNYAVCNSEKEFIDFYNCQCDTLSTLNKDWLTSEKSRFYKYNYNIITCKTITLDKLIHLYGIPELIKIDVEGGEFDCISSLTIKVNNLCFEWASETNEITFKCLDYLSKLGYTNFAIQYEDNYVYRPTQYYDINYIKNIIRKTTPKKEWGMIWVK